MNKHEFQNTNRLKDDMKKRFDDNTEFAKEFTSKKFETTNDLDKENYQIELDEHKKNN